MGLRGAARSLVLRTASGLRLIDLAMGLQARGHAPQQLVVVGMHETPSSDQLRSQLNWVAEHFTFIDPESFAQAWSTNARTWSGSKPAALFTFDDGRASNYLVAAPILESFGTRGIFFIVPQFIGRTAGDAQDFYYSRIDIRKRAAADPKRPLLNADGKRDEIWKPMTPDQLSDLARRGHWIGNHTLSHARLPGLSAAELQREINESCQQIASWTGKPVDAFAWPYSWNAIDRDSWEVIKQAHRFCFSPCPGTVDPATDSQHLIWRKEIESYYCPFEYQFMYSGLVDPFWSAKRMKLRKILGR